MGAHAHISDHATFSVLAEGILVWGVHLPRCSQGHRSSQTLLPIHARATLLHLACPAQPVVLVHREPFLRSHERRRVRLVHGSWVVGHEDAWGGLVVDRLPRSDQCITGGCIRHLAEGLITHTHH